MQLKRLGSPNFTDLPVNAARGPVALFQQDGHMTLANPQGRANYEPNSWGDEGGPREDPASGFGSFATREAADTRRVRSESFADHYSQARQFYVSQTPNERDHIAASFTFELSKVQRADIRERMVAGLVNVHEDLATERIGGGPSVLFDAVAIIPGEADATVLAEHPGVQAFVADAFAHCKFVGFDPAAEAILRAAAITEGRARRRIRDPRQGQGRSHLRRSVSRASVLGTGSFTPLSGSPSRCRPPRG